MYAFYHFIATFIVGHYTENLLSIWYIENNAWTRAANCLCVHESVILLYIFWVARQRGKKKTNKQNNTWVSIRKDASANMI